MRTVLRRLLTATLLLGGVYAALNLVVTIRSGGSYELVLVNEEATGVYVPYVRSDGLRGPGSVRALLFGRNHASASAPVRAGADWQVDERDGVSNAWTAAHRVLGRYVDPGRSLVVERVEPGSVAARAGIRPGDRIEAVNELPGSMYALVAAVWNSGISTPRPPIVLGLEGGSTARVSVGNDELGRPVIEGLTVSERERFGSGPPEVLRPERMKGESFGLSAALVFAAHLADQDGYGVKVAATGVIFHDGTVGEVIGIREKMEAANRLRAEIVLVPKVNLAEARAHLDPGIELVGVETLNEAIGAVCSVGRCAPALRERP